MKRIIYSLSLSLLISSAGLSAAKGAVVISDGFESYAQETLTNGATWSSSIPGTTIAWQTRASTTASRVGGESAIVSGATYGKEGQIYSAKSTSSRKAGIMLDLPADTISAIDSNTWTITMEFNLNSYTFSNSSTVGILSIQDSSQSAGAEVLTFSFYDGDLRVQHGTQTSGSFLNTFATDLSLNTWYTLTVTGNNLDGGTASISLVGGGADYSLNDVKWRYNSSGPRHSFFDRVVIGGGNDASIQSELLVDNFALTAIPEPSFALVTIGAIGIFLLKGRKRRAA